LRRREARARAARTFAASAAGLVVAIAAFLGPARWRSEPSARPLAASDGAVADEFLLGAANAYLTCEWIPSASPPHAGNGEVEF